MVERTLNWQRLYRELGPQVWAYLRRRVRDVNLADDLLQETFLASASNPAGLLAAESKRAWLIGIARNLLRDQLRRGERERALIHRSEPPNIETTEENPRLEAMRHAITKLPEAQREVLDLRLRQDLSYAEIAEALEIPIGTVRSRIHHAVSALRDWAAATTDDAN